jgi:hypothetical protein
MQAVVTSSSRVRICFWLVASAVFGIATKRLPLTLCIPAGLFGIALSTIAMGRITTGLGWTVRLDGP